MTDWPVSSLVLTAGHGTRLRPLTDLRAKPALPVGNEALVCRVLRHLATEGIGDAVLNLHHLPHTVARAVGDGTGMGVRVRYSWEQPQLLGSAGGIRHALPLLYGDTFLVVNGDTLCDVPLRALVDEHRRTGARVTLALIAHPHQGRYGGVQVDADGCVLGFPGRHTTVETWHYPGIQVVNRDVFESLPDDIPAESVRQVYPALMAEARDSVRGAIFDASFRDIGTLEQYIGTCTDLAGDAVGNAIGLQATVAPDAVLARTVVWDGGHVGPACRLTDCVVTDRAYVQAGTVATGEVFV